MSGSFTKLSWVPDGYCMSVELLGHQLVYRPMTQAERACLWSLNPSKETLVSAAFSRVVVGGERLDWYRATLEGSSDTLRDFLNAVIRPGDKNEAEDARNLYEGVKLQKTPYASLNSFDACDWCKKHWFDPLTGSTCKIDGVYVKREGEPLLCETPGACPVGHFTRRNTLSHKNRLAYAHRVQCTVTGKWPDDPIVSRNAEIINRALNDAKDGRNVFKPIV